jgi:hypothetical protein
MMNVICLTKNQLLRSLKIVIMAPIDEESLEFKKISEMVDGDDTSSAVIEINPAKAMNKSSWFPLAWVVTQLVMLFLDYFKSSYDTRLSIGGTVQNPSPDAVPKDLLGESLEVDQQIAWQDGFTVIAFSIVHRLGKLGFQTRWCILSPQLL